MLRNYLFRAITVAALYAALNMSAQTTPWKQFNYSDEGFAASFPSAPSLEKKAVQTSAGEFELRSYVVEAGDTSLFVGVCDYREATAEKTPDQLLLGAKKSMLANSGSRILNEKKIALGPNPGVQFEAENSATHFSARIFMVGSTLYEELVVSSLSKPYDRTAQFLDSFQLVSRTIHDPKN